MARKQDRTSGLLRKFGRLLKDTSSEATAERVHHLRTTVRRIETIFSAHPDSSSPKLLKRMAKLRRRAGKVRDVDVQLVALQGLKLESGARDRAQLSRALEQMRSRRARKLGRKLEDATDYGLEKSLRRALTIPPLTEKQQRTRKEEYVVAALDKFSTAVEERGKLNEQNLHDFRMDCKRARYLAEMAAPLPKAKTIVTQLKRIQDAVGDWHDWLTLCASAEKNINGDRPSPLITALRTQTQSRFLHALQEIEECKRSLLALRAIAPRKPVSAAAQTSSAVA